MGSILLHFGLVDVCQSLASIPSYLFFGVHTFDLDQRCVWVLVWFGSKKQHQDKSASTKPRHLTESTNLVKIIEDTKNLPFVSKDGTPHIESNTNGKEV